MESEVSGASHAATTHADDGGRAWGTAPRTRTQEAYERLARMARAAGPNGQLPTFAELRETLGVSVATLNSALGLLEARRVLYRRHGVGIFVSPTLGRKNIALVCSPKFFEGPEISPFWHILLEQVRRHAAERRHDLALHFSRDEDGGQPLYDDFMAAVGQERVHGVIGVGLLEEAVSWLTARGVPVVGFAGAGRYRVDIDYHRAVAVAVAHLANAGCRRVALWTNHHERHLPEQFWKDRAVVAESPLFATYRAALREAGLSPDPALERRSTDLNAETGEEPPRMFWQQGYQIATEVFGAGGDPALRPDAIISPSELFSQGIIMGLQAAGLRVGADMRLVSHANADSPVLRPWEGQIERFEVSPPALSRTLIGLLESLLAGEEVEDPAPVHYPEARFSPAAVEVAA